LYALPSCTRPWHEEKGLLPAPTSAEENELLTEEVEITLLGFESDMDCQEEKKHHL
jgi:hypothetical protein